MAVKLSTGAMPPSNVGRKPILCDQALVDGLVAFLRDNAVQDLGEDLQTPGYAGPEDHLFATESRAQGEGRRYAKVVREAIGKTVKVNVYDNSEKDAKRRFLWRLYIPLSESLNGEGN